tara:strand:+ start:2382 stop:4724 length:2343 start_codon:yes stop_codon:yes gene_type:complete
MTKRIKKLFSYIFFLFFFIVLLLISTYSFLVYQPKNAIKFLDKAFIYDYSLSIKSISSNKNFFKPFYIIEQLQVNDNKKNELVFIPNLKIGLNLIDSLINEYISLSILEIDSLKSSQGQSSKTFEPFLIKGNRLKISNKTFDISARNFEFVISLNNTKIVLLDGNVNSYPFEYINALIDSNENKMFYESNHILNSKQLNQIDTLNLSSLDTHDISLKFSSKGYVDFKTNKNLRFDKLVFQNSSITTNSKFLIKNINSTIFSNLNNELLGIFESTLPDQNISGSIFYDYNQSVIRTNLKIIMDRIIDSNRYFSMDGNEVFNTTILLSKDNFSMKLLSNLRNTNISSSIKEIEGKLNKELETLVFIEDISNPTYRVKNAHINALIDSSGNGYFAFGDSFSEEIKAINPKNGFFIFLDLNNFKLDDIFYDSSAGNNPLLRLIQIKSKEFNFLNNKYSNINFKVAFEDEIFINIAGKNLNGQINIDETNFIKINLKDTKFNFDGIDLAQANLASDINNLSLRLIGNNIKTDDDLIQDIDFYILKNDSLLTIDNIKIDSKRLKIGPGEDNQKAYISYNNKSDLYKIRGKYIFDNSSGYFNKLTKYNFNFFESDLHIQWNSLDTLTNLEGRINFLIKNLSLDANIPETTFLKALKIFNLNGIIEGFDGNSNNSLNVNRALGKLIIGKNRALITTPIVFETNESYMKWIGNIGKNNQGELDKLNLDLSMRIKISENIPWYSVILGGMPALAGGALIENIFEDTIEEASTINFQILGNIKNPNIKRLD